ncbi:MAG: DUF3303 family protein [Thermoleophilia bacterium]
MLFLIEAYVARGDAHAIPATVARLRRQARAASAQLHSAIHLPDDETCFYLVQAVDAHAVHRLAAAAGIDAQRIGEALDWPAHVVPKETP